RADGAPAVSLLILGGRHPARSLVRLVPVSEGDVFENQSMAPRHGVSRRCLRSHGLRLAKGLSAASGDDREHGEGPGGGARSDVRHAARAFKAGQRRSARAHVARIALPMPPRHTPGTTDRAGEAEAVTADRTPAAPEQRACFAFAPTSPTH